MLRNLGTRTAATLAALAVTALLVAGCGDGPDTPDATPSDATGEVAEPECITDGFDFEQAETVSEGSYTDIVPNGSGALLVRDEAGQPSILRAGNLAEQIPIEGLPESGGDGEMEVEPAPDGFVVQTQGTTDGLSSDDAAEELSYVTNDGEVAWTREASNPKWFWNADGRYLVDGVKDDGRYLVDDVVFVDIETGEEVDDPRPGEQWGLADNTLSGSPVAFGNGDGTYLDENGEPLTEIPEDALVTDEWVLQIGEARQIPDSLDVEVTLSGHHLDGGSNWQRDVKADPTAIGICGQYVYVPAADGVHVLDQNADGEEIALLTDDMLFDGTTSDVYVDGIDGYQPKGFLAWKRDGETNYSAMPN